MNRTGFSQVGIPYKNFSEFIPQHDSDPHILSLCQHILLSVEISESGRQPESRIPRKSNESRTSYTRIPACGTPYFTDDNKESEQKTKINTRFKRYLSIFAEYRKPVAAKSGKSVLRATFHVLVHNDRLKSDGLP